MREDNIKIFVKEISKDDFFDFFDNVDIEQYLDERDSDPFDSIWINNFNRVKALVFSKEQLETINEIREMCFKSALRATGDSDLASYITDDIEIIIKDMIYDNNNEWTITDLWASYKNKKLPC